jgi:hypothetical protein
MAGTSWWIKGRAKTRQLYYKTFRAALPANMNHYRIFQIEPLSEKRLT